MIRIVKMSGKYYGTEIKFGFFNSDDEIEQIEEFVNEGTPVILVNELQDLESLGIDPDDVQMVIRD